MSENMEKTANKAETSIYNVDNPYGYRLNVNHPRIKVLYERYMVWKGIIGRPPTDAERFEFESMVLKSRE